MNFNDGMTRKMIKLLDHTELTNTEIAEAVGVHRQDVERFKRRRNEPTSLSEEELACTQPTDGFLYYLRGGNDGV
jgi:IS30 family transposase